MSPQLRVRLQKLLTFVSFLVAVAATVFWWQFRQAGAATPMWLLGVLGYGWTFTAFLVLNMVGKRYARKRRRKPIQKNLP